MARINWRHDLTAPLHALQHELNRLFEDYRSSGFFGSHPSGSGPGTIAWVPAVDLYETPEAVVIEADLPGVDPSAIELSVTGNLMTLRGEKPAGSAPPGHGSGRERQFGTFFRQLTLPNEVDVDAIQAESHNGVLKVVLPKIASAKPHSIPIHVS
jgi:HSP20 family protein